MIIRFFLLIFCLSCLQLFAQKSIPKLEHLLDVQIKKNKYDTATINILKDLHNEYINVNPYRALEYSQMALDIAEKLNNPNEISTLYNYFGNLYRKQGVNELAIKYHLKSMQLAQELGEPGKMAYTFNDVGNIYFDQKNYSKAKEYYSKALVISHKHSLLKEKAVTLNNLAILYRTNQQYEKALKFFKAALKLRQQLNDPFLVAHSHLYIAAIYRKMGNYDAALASIRQTLDLIENKTSLEFEESRFEAEIYESGAVIYAQMNDVENALLYYNMAIDILEAHNFQSELPQVYLSLGKFYLNHQQYSEAKEITKKALELASESGMLPDQERALELLAKIYVATNDYRVALDYYQQRELIRDSLSTEKAEYQLANIQAEDMLEKKERELLLSQQQYILQEKKLETNRIKLVLVIIFLIIVFLLLGIITVRYMHKARRNSILKQKNIIIDRQKKKIEKNNRELQIANRNVKAALQAKTEFLSNMSHEIRTPMNGIIGFTDLLIENEINKSKIEDLNSIKFSAQNLLIIINDILEYSNMEAGKIKLEIIPFDLHQLITELMKTVNVNLAKNISVEAHLTNDVPKRVKGDPTRLYQILLNLVSNAVKFTNEGTVQLWVRMVQEKNEIVKLHFEIRDTGIGIPQEKLEYIFDRFTQATNDTKRKYGGTGLGLAISKELIELQGGSIAVTSQENIGSIFYFELEFYKSLNNKKENGHHPANNKGMIKGMKVLYAEDNPMNQLLTKKILDKWHIETDIAENGQEAIKMLSQKTYDLVLMDIQMPVVDGMEATVAIRNKDFNQNIPIIGLTADIFETTRIEALTAGMNDIITKPVDQDELFQKLLHYQSKAHLQHI